MTAIVEVAESIKVGIDVRTVILYVIITRLTENFRPAMVHHVWKQKENAYMYGFRSFLILTNTLESPFWFPAEN